VNRPTECVPDAEHRPEGVRPGSQVGNLTQEFERVPFLLERKGLRVGFPVDRDRSSLKLNPLFLAGGFLQGPFDLETGPRMDPFHQLGIAGNAVVHHDLEIGQTTAVVDLQKEKVLLGFPFGANPPPDIDLFAGRPLL